MKIRITKEDQPNVWLIPHPYHHSAANQMAVEADAGLSCRVVCGNVHGERQYFDAHGEIKHFDVDSWHGISLGLDKKLLVCDKNKVVLVTIKVNHDHEITFE